MIERSSKTEKCETKISVAAEARSKQNSLRALPFSRSLVHSLACHRRRRREEKGNEKRDDLTNHPPGIDYSLNRQSANRHRKHRSSRRGRPANYQKKKGFLIFDFTLKLHRDLFQRIKAFELPSSSSRFARTPKKLSLIAIHADPQIIGEDCPAYFSRRSTSYWASEI